MAEAVGLAAASWARQAVMRSCTCCEASCGTLQPSSVGVLQPSSVGVLQLSSVGVLQPSSVGLLCHRLQDAASHHLWHGLQLLDCC